MMLGRTLWLAPGEASGVWTHLYQSKATMAESLQGRGTCCSCGRWRSHSGHCRRHKPWHGNSFKTSSSMRNEPIAEPTAKANEDFSGDSVNASQCWWTNGEFSSLSPCRSQDAKPIPSMSHSQWGFVTLPQASCSPGHQSRHPEGTHSQDTGKLSFEFLQDVVQLLIRRKWQNKHSFVSNLIWKSICLQQNYWQINSRVTFHFGSEAPMVDMTELFIQISTWYVN